MSHDVAIVHDYLTQRGGAERVVLAMAGAFPGAPVYTSVYQPLTTFPEFRDLDVRPLWTNRISALRRDHRRGLPVYPLAFSTASIDARVTICSSSGFAHGVRTSGRKVVYCYTPPRWLYGQAGSYLAPWSKSVRLGARALRGPLRAWDRRAARSADEVLTSSTAMCERIQKTYGITPQLLPPPLTMTTDGPRDPVPGIAPGFLLSVGRLLAYKNLDAVVAAMEELPEHRLVIAGSGPERDRLGAMAGCNVRFVEQVTEAQLSWLYANSAGVIAASYEDYGLTPIEAAAHGRPTAALRFGGFLDTVEEGTTGLFFTTPEATAIAESVRQLIGTTWDAEKLRSYARRYGVGPFLERLRLVAVDGVIQPVQT